MKNIRENPQLFNEFHALLVHHAKEYCQKIPYCAKCVLLKKCKFKKKNNDLKKNSKSKKTRHIFIVSDATGSTCEMVVKAALIQFRTTDVHLHRVRYVRTEKEIRDVVQEVMAVDGIIAYTFVSNELRDLIFDQGRKWAVPTIDVMGPLLSRFTDYLEISPMAVPGMFRSLDKNYYQRIECIDFAVKHDDGKKLTDMYKADIIIVGPSRTSKTPISIYLAYRDYKIANIPMIFDINLPDELLQVDQKKLLG